MIRNGMALGQLSHSLDLSSPGGLTKGFHLNEENIIESAVLTSSYFKNVDGISYLPWCSEIP